MRYRESKSLHVYDLIFHECMLLAVESNTVRGFVVPSVAKNLVAAGFHFDLYDS